MGIMNTDGIREAFVELSCYAGNRFDWVQAGGGNSSVKLDSQKMLIKASGIRLLDVSDHTGYVTCDYRALRQCTGDSEQFSNKTKKMREELGKNATQAALLSSEGQPSIETFLHALMGKFTLHTHPIAINVMMADDRWQERAKRIYPDAVFVPYATPGIDLALLLAAQIKHYVVENQSSPEVVFLQNHGLIVSSDSAERVLELTEVISSAACDATGMNLAQYQQVSRLYRVFKERYFKRYAVVLSEDQALQHALTAILGQEKNERIWPFCPDTLIYCGPAPLVMEASIAKQSLQSLERAVIGYEEQYFNEPPKVILATGNVYFIAESLKKAKDAEELFKFHCLVRQAEGAHLTRISEDEVAYLLNWDAEKYRQNVG